MGDNLYIAYWQSVLPAILDQFKAGKQTVKLEVKELAQNGGRQSYYSNFRIVKGILEIPKNAYAQGRDLYQVLVADEYFKETFASSTIQVTISKNFELKMEILEATAPDFFTEEDFEQLAKFEKERWAENNEGHKITYEFLKGSYNKLEYWAKQVQMKLFKEGVVNLRKRPTNQASRFESYQWAKIYPDKQTADSGILAYTVTVDTDYRFTVKIDTVGLADSDERRQKYVQVRGDYDHSAIVKILPADQVLDKGWKYLIDLTANIITNLKPAFDSLLSSLTGLPLNSTTATNPIRPDMPLNTILYGPPGTGKTYHTINKAVAIASPVFNTSKATREETKAEYERLAKEGLIEFVTFHQSMSYEDFIEGIKPDLSNGDNTLTYIIEDGMFKSLSQRAHQKSLIQDNFSGAYNQLLQEIEDNDGALVLKTLKKGKEFTIYENSKGNLRFHANTEKAYEGVITREYIETYLQTGEAIDWPSYTRAVGEYLRLKYNYKSQQKTLQQNYVLIIDEINRGNVSQIFGELITLIEEDKRAGREESLKVTLPYSKKPFSVPANLYIIGTMNTADRSVEALDTALRRRFSFEEMLPKPDLLSPYHLLQRLWLKHWLAEPGTKEWDSWEADENKFIELSGLNYDGKLYKALADKYEKEGNQAEWMAADPKELFKGIVSFKDGLDLSELLLTINMRLRVLLTKDHTIGHAWLMNVFSLDDLRTAFKSKIIPLLQEYFYNDYAKIGLVLGNSFVEQTKAGKSLFAQFKDDDQLAMEYEDKLTYSLKDCMELTIKDFKSIYQSIGQ